MVKHQLAERSTQLAQALAATEAKVAEVRSELESEVAEVRAELESKVTKVRGELESISSDFQKVVNLLPHEDEFKHYVNNVFIVKIKPATTKEFEYNGTNEEGHYDYFYSTSAKQELTGAEIHVSHNHRVYSDKNED